jgi:phosphonoacetaldehyde hydrolase
MVKQVEAVIFDWSGTTVDHGSLAPVKAVSELFARHGIQLSAADVRRDMGIYKKDHIRNILNTPHIAAAWHSNQDAPPKESDVEALFAQFIPLQFEVLEAYSTVISGVTQTVDRLRAQGLKVGSTTGYTRPMLDILLSSAKQIGYSPDLSLSPDDVGGGRPHPWMCLRIALEFRLSSVACAVKVGDTVSDIEEAHNAGMWAVGVINTGNEVGMSAEELAALPIAEREEKFEQARQRLLSAGADYLIDDIAGIQPVLAKINAAQLNNDRKGVALPR